MIRLPSAHLSADRYEPVIERCRGLRILHAGCCGMEVCGERTIEQPPEHFDAIRVACAAGHTMHQQLAKVATELCGVDIDRKGVEYMRQLGFDDLLVADVCDPSFPSMLAGREFDIIVATELVEHLANPGLFLRNARELMTASGSTLILTVPNAFWCRAFCSTMWKREIVHPGHLYWFSYSTITALLKGQGYVVREVLLYSMFPFTRRASKARRALRGLAVARAAEVAGSRRRGGLVLHALRRAPGLSAALGEWILCHLVTPFWGSGLVVVAGVKQPDTINAVETRQS